MELAHLEEQDFALDNIFRQHYYTVHAYKRYE
jgi:hypothetical protein